MFVKSPERHPRRALQKPNNFTASYQGTSDKRLKSLDSRSSMQNRHFNSYQLQNGKSILKTTVSVSSASNSQQDNFQDMSKTQVVEQSSERSCSTEETKVNFVNHNHIQSDPINSPEWKKQSKKNQAMQVFVRVRPLNSRELQGQNGERIILNISEDKKCVIVDQKETKQTIIGSSNKEEKKIFEMNQVFSENTSNNEIFEQIIKQDLKHSLFEGYNCTCFVYGMTGAGKTFTMFGDISNYLTMNSEVKGLIMHSLKEILILAKIVNQSQQKKKEKCVTEQDEEDNTDWNRESKKQFTKQTAESKVISCRVKLSYLEIYNETIRDLLSAESSENLMMIEDPARGVFVPELTEKEVNVEEEVLESIRIGNTRRQMASTGLNEFSSRSHAIITFFVEQTRVEIVPQKEGNFQQKDAQSNKRTIVTTSKLCLVDLAGSERAAITENKGVRLQEGANINRSLLALGNCINILGDTTKKGAFVPYRDSKLTRLLKDSLGGNTQTYMIACVSPAVVACEETLNTLKYAQRAKKIQKNLTKNEKILATLSSQNSTQYLQLIESMRKEIDSLKTQLAVQNSKARLPLPFVPQQQQQQQQQQYQITSREDINLRVNSLCDEDGRSSFISACNEKDTILKTEPTYEKQDSSPDNREFTALEQISGPFQQWLEHDSFSSSGKSVRISCSDASNNGSVIMFKRSPSQLSFAKQQQVHQQKTTESMQMLSTKILKNLEENWEIQQSIIELNNLKKQNEEIVEEKQQRLKKLKNNLLQWPHENEINQISLGIAQLQNTMGNNQSIQDNLKLALIRNEANKQELQEEMLALLSQSSDEFIKTMQQTCKALQIEKNDLENANLKMKQQHLQIQTQFQQKLTQIKSMEQQIQSMQRELDEKNKIINRNINLSSPNAATQQLFPSRHNPHHGYLNVNSKPITTTSTNSVSFLYSQSQKQNEQSALSSIPEMNKLKTRYADSNEQNQQAGSNSASFFPSNNNMNTSISSYRFSNLSIRGGKRQTSSEANRSKLQINMQTSATSSFVQQQQQQQQQQSTIRSTSSQSAKNKKFVLEQKSGYLDFKNQNSLLDDPSNDSSKQQLLQGQKQVPQSVRGGLTKVPAIRTSSPSYVPKSQIAPGAAPASSFISTKKAGITEGVSFTNQPSKINQFSQKSFASPSQQSARLSTLCKKSNSSSLACSTSVFNKKSQITHREKHANSSAKMSTAFSSYSSTSQSSFQTPVAFQRIKTTSQANSYLPDQTRKDTSQEDQGNNNNNNYNSLEREADRLTYYSSPKEIISKRVTENSRIEDNEEIEETSSLQDFLHTEEFPGDDLLPLTSMNQLCIGSPDFYARSKKDPIGSKKQDPLQSKTITLHQKNNSDVPNLTKVLPGSFNNSVTPTQDTKNVNIPSAFSGKYLSTQPSYPNTFKPDSSQFLQQQQNYHLTQKQPLKHSNSNTSNPKATHFQSTAEYQVNNPFYNQFQLTLNQEDNINNTNTNFDLTQKYQPESQKESNIVTPDHSISIHKIDLFKEFSDQPKNEETQRQNQNNKQLSFDANIQGILSPLNNPFGGSSSPIKLNTTHNQSVFQILPQPEDASNLPPPPSQRFNSFTTGVLKTQCHEGKENSKNKALGSHPHRRLSLSPSQKVNNAVQDVIEKQKQKSALEYQRHLVLSNLASNILNPESNMQVIPQGAQYFPMQQQPLQNALNTEVYPASQTNKQIKNNLPPNNVVNINLCSIQSYGEHKQQQRQALNSQNNIQDMQTSINKKPISYL